MNARYLPRWPRVLHTNSGGNRIGWIMENIPITPSSSYSVTEVHKSIAKLFEAQAANWPVFAKPFEHVSGLELPDCPEELVLVLHSQHTSTPAHTRPLRTPIRQNQSRPIRFLYKLVQNWFCNPHVPNSSGFKVVLKWLSRWGLVFSFVRSSCSHPILLT